MKYGYFNHGDLIPTIDSFTVGAYILVVCSPTDYISKAVTLEDLGWTVRDCIKVLLQDKTLQVGLFRKPFKGTVANNVLTNGCGGLNIGISRITHNEIIKETTRKGRVDGKAIVFNDKSCGFDNTKNIIASASPLGRFPANLILDSEAGELLDKQSGSVGGNSGGSYKNKSLFFEENDAPKGYTDSGGASRFFYNANSQGELKEYLINLIKV
jgi:hypothetical protein